MKEDVANDCWIAGQLAGIRMLESELTDALKTPRPRAAEGLRRRVAQLNAWLNLVDDALKVRVRSGQKPRHLAGRVVMLPVYDSSGRLPAA